MNAAFNAGPDLYLERENAINESCYAASRLLDLCRYKGLQKDKQASVLALYALPHAPDFPALVKTF
jgi:hypothetical protein